MTPPQAVLFDLDGTLVDSAPLIAAAMTETLADHGVRVEEPAVAAAIGPPLADVVRGLAGVSEAASEAIFADYVERYVDRYVQGTPPKPGASELLEALTAEGVSLALVTNKHLRSARAVLDAVGWTEVFDAVVGAGSAPRPKPYADPALLALRQLGAPASDAALVGDSEFDMACGRNAEVASVVGLTFTRTPLQLETAGATFTCDSLDEVRTLLLEGA